MGATSIDKAIYAHWNGVSLSNTITGGIHHGVPERTRKPYCSFSNVSVVTTGRSNTSHYDRQTVQFAIYHTQKSLASSLAYEVKNAFDDVNLVLDAGDALQMRCASGPLLVDVGKGVWSAVLTFDVDRVERRS